MNASPSTDELWQRSAVDLVAGYTNKEFSPRDVLDSVFDRLDKINPKINAVVTVDREGALSAAAASEKRWLVGEALGPLDGVPLTVKDNIPVRGLRTTWGSNLYSNYLPAADELPIARLREVGAIILGKTNCPEFTLQGYTDNLLFGPTRNPWNLELTPGGSSGGAVAAVSAGIGPIAIGTDGGGSIRRPAAHTGLVGLKPSRGRVPRSDGLPAILDFRTHVSHGSNYNTPPVFAIYVMTLITRWLRFEVGGLRAMQSINERKARRLYETLDSLGDAVTVHADRRWRSQMNAAFTFGDSRLDEAFTELALEYG